MNYINKAKEELTKQLADQGVLLGKGMTNMYTLLVLIKGKDCTLKDVHDAWAVNINAVWDKEKNGDHRSLIPFDELSHETQEKDRVFCDAIHETARVLKAK